MIRDSKTTQIGMVALTAEKEREVSVTHWWMNRSLSSLENMKSNIWPMTLRTPMKSKLRNNQLTMQYNNKGIHADTECRHIDRSGLTKVGERKTFMV